MVEFGGKGTGCDDDVVEGLIGCFLVSWFHFCFFPREGDNMYVGLSYICKLSSSGCHSLQVSSQISPCGTLSVFLDSALPVILSGEYNNMTLVGSHASVQVMFAIDIETFGHWRTCACWRGTCLDGFKCRGMP